jgi:thiol-disulfide isomerase/thioredoxin
MLSVPLGPLALPLNPLLMLGGAWLASVLAARLAARAGAEARTVASTSTFRAAVAGLAGARLAFVTQEFESYASAPLTMIDVRDGGWLPWAGVLCAAVVLAWYGWRHAPLRRPLAAGAAAGLARWGGLSVALGVHERMALPALTFVDLAGKPVALKDASAGAPMVVNLWATWCGPCRAEMPVLAAAQQREQGVRFVFVNHGEAAPAVQQWLAQQPWRIENVLLDKRMQLGAAIGSAGLPTTLFVAADGRVAAHRFGPLSAASLQAQLRLLRPAGAAR